MRYLAAIACLLLPAVANGQTYASVLASAQNYWDCQEASGSLADSAGSATLTADGSPGYRSTGPTTWLPYAVDLSSGNNFSAASPAGRVSVPFTIVAWANPNNLSALPNNAAILARRGGTYEYHFRVEAVADALSVLTTNGSTTASTTTIPTNDWHFIAVAVDASNVYFYIDGTLETVSATRTITDQAVSLRLGASSSSTNDAWDGQLAGVGVWDSALNEASLDALYAGPTGDPNPLTPTIPGGTPDPLKRILGQIAPRTIPLSQVRYLPHELTLAP